MDDVIVWLVLLILFLIIEGITAGLATIWFAGGALIALAAAWFHAGILAQVILFFVVSLVLLIFTRPIAVKYLEKGNEKTNIESFPGKRAIVTEKIDNLHETGKVKLQDVDWRARSTKDDVCIETGEVIVIREVKGVTLIVDKEDKK